MINNTTSNNGRSSDGEFKQWLGIKAVFGYLHEFREIPNSNPPAHSVRLSVPQGRGESIRYFALELVVDSLRVFHLLNKHADKINDSAVKSTMTFNCYGLHPKAYALKNKDGSLKLNDKAEPELRSFNAGKITHISYLKVDNVVYFGGNSGSNNEYSNVAGSIATEDASQKNPGSATGNRKGKSARKAVV